jgi:hypothetical protein
MLLFYTDLLATYFFEAPQVDLARLDLKVPREPIQNVDPTSTAWILFIRRACAGFPWLASRSN